MKNIKILVDFGRSFVDEDGSFYCGTTEEQKDKAVEINKEGDLIIYLSDVHTKFSREFLTNGGPYPAHNAIKRDQQEHASLDVDPEKTLSPQLTERLYDMVKDRKSGLIVPRHVFFQDYDGGPNYTPAFTFNDIEQTFGVKALNPQEFLDGGIDYIVNAKHMFNGASLQSTEWMGNIPGVPSIEMNAFTLLKQQHGQGADLQFDLTGVVMGICVYQTASNLRQIFPKADINVIADGCTHLVYAPLGIATEQQGNEVAKAMCQQVGVKYITTAEYLATDK